MNPTPNNFDPALHIAITVGYLFMLAGITVIITYILIKIEKKK